MGFHPARLARLDAHLTEKYLAPGRLPCSLVMLARHGDVAHLGVQGMADVERGLPLASDTIFRIYSMTKPIVSAAFLMLVEEGRIALDDPVHRHIPSWKQLKAYAGGDHQTGFQTRPLDRPMLIVDLLRHTSGLTYGFQQRTPIDAAYRALKIGEVDKAGTLETMIEALAALPLEFSPGEAWNYSVSTDVIGYLIEKISGQSLDVFLQERLFGPLGMVDTGFHVAPQSARRLASCYQATPTGGFKLQDDAHSSPFLTAPDFRSGGGGLVSTAADFLRFAQMILGKGRLDGHRYLSRKTIDLMTANHLPGGVDLPALSRSMFSEASYEGVGFGLGFADVQQPHKTLIPGSAGDLSWGGMASTFFWIDPAEQLIGLFMTQLIPSSTYPVRREVRTLAYAALDD
jgi:CubicO group peptidase (beta-lactamase class C family)